MAVAKDRLPELIYLEDYKGNYQLFIDAVYAVFERDFITHKATFGSHQLKMKYHPAFQERAYTFYHMTHEGDIETDRTPDLRRCERMPWARRAFVDGLLCGLFPSAQEEGERVSGLEGFCR